METEELIESKLKGYCIMVTNSEGGWYGIKEEVKQEIGRGSLTEVKNMKEPQEDWAEDMIRPASFMDFFKGLVGRGEFLRERKEKVQEKMIDEKGLAVLYVGGGYRVDVDADAVDVEEKIGGEAEREAEGYVRDNLDYIEENTGLKIRDLGFWDYHFS